MDFKFDKEKILYPFVMNYLAMHHGNIDLISRYFYNRIKDLKIKGADLPKVLCILEVDEKRRVVASWEG